MQSNAQCKPVLEALSEKTRTEQFCGTSKQLTEFCIYLEMVYGAVILQVFMGCMLFWVNTNVHLSWHYCTLAKKVVLK